MIHHGDCIEVMAAMEPESVDAIVTDPPYGLEFMGKEWDRLGDDPVSKSWDTKGRNENKPRRVASCAGGRHAVSYKQINPRCRNCGRAVNGRDTAKGFKVCSCDKPDWYQPNTFGVRQQEWHARWAAEALRVAKPSAYLLAFGGTRTVHRMTVALEDAGWIIRDMLVWAYASGFPKSKASLKPAWEPIVMARKPGPLRMLAIDECRIPGAEDGSRNRPPSRLGSDTTYAQDEWTRNAIVERNDTTGLGRWPANVILTDPIFDGGVEGVVGGGEVKAGIAVNRNRLDGSGGYGGWARGDGEDVGYGDSGTYSRFFLVPKADREDREPILPEYVYQIHKERGECVVTLPARATSADSTVDDSGSNTSLSGSRTTDHSQSDTRSTTSTGTRPTTDSAISASSIPSPINVSTPAVSSYTANGSSPAESAASSSLWETPTGISVVRAGRSTDGADHATSEPSSRRNVCARCGRRLPRFSTHPTQKPTELMRHLVRLVTPSGGTVLDPFLGSGTTGLACELEGFPWIGIEKEAEYVAIAEARLNGTQRGLGLDVPAPSPRAPHPAGNRTPIARKADSWFGKEQGTVGHWPEAKEDPAA